MRLTRLSTIPLLALLCCAPAAYGAPFKIGSATDLFVPSFRGASNTSWVGWDTFDDGGAGDRIINDSTPDIGTDSGLLATTNGEVHQSGSLNYYAGPGSVAEDVSFATAGVDGSGFTTVIVQAKTLFGGFGVPIEFGPIGGVEPTKVVQADNATGSGQIFVTYELPGTASVETFSMASIANSHTSLDKVVVDTYWSPDGYAVDCAVIPEPTSASLLLIGVAGMLVRRRCRSRRHPIA